MKSLFHSSLYPFDTPRGAGWEAAAGDVDQRYNPLAGARNCDLATAGGGYTGLSAALVIVLTIPIEYV